jgi:hypothetical protein
VLNAVRPWDGFHWSGSMAAVACRRLS